MNVLKRLSISSNAGKYMALTFFQNLYLYHHRAISALQILKSGLAQVRGNRKIQWIAAVAA